MRNEILLLGSVLIVYGGILLAYRIFGKAGLFCLNVTVTILANIEVLLLVNAFGMEQTLGNVLFASTYLITDILSENEGKKEANKAVWLGVMTTVAMLIITQYWFFYIPSPNDTIMPAIQTIFSSTPRLILASFLGYVISQRLDVWLYHTLWDFTTHKYQDSHRFLWLRNNAATMLSQIINTLLFSLIAFYGKYDTHTLISIIFSSYVIYVFTALLDTPFVYLARKMNEHSQSQRYSGPN